jgi:hypothetical protein
MHVLPKGFHRVRHYGLFAGTKRAANIARARELLNVPAPTPPPPKAVEPDAPRRHPSPCPCCRSTMLVIETFRRGESPRHKPSPKPRRIWIDTS